MFAAKSHNPPQKKIVPLPPRNPRLSVEQHKAIQLLLAGYTAIETASLIGKSRDTVSRWKNENVHFITEFNRQHGELCDGVKFRLQSLTSKAVEVMEQHLNQGNLKAATELLKIVNLYGNIPSPDLNIDEEMVVKLQAEKMAVMETKKAPFSEATEIDAVTKLLADDIAGVLKERYGVTSKLQDFADQTTEN